MHMIPIIQQLAEDAARCEAAGVPFNPELPPRFGDTPNDQRPPSHQSWWHRPFIQTYTLDTWEAHYAALTEDVRTQWAESGRGKWMEAWPSGIRYDVRCLDGGAWDRPTCWGMFATLEEALACVRDRRPIRSSGMMSTKTRCHCGRRLWWGAENPPLRHWVPPTGRESEPDVIEDCTPGVAVPTTCPEHRA